jgi:hypothetical protein
MTSQNPAFLLIDRTAVLFCGVAAGIAIGLAFAPQINGWLGEGAAPVVGMALPPAQGGLPTEVAGDANAPAALRRAVAEKRSFRIGVFGDSFGDGLWAALYNQLPRREAFHVLRQAQQATGFTRYRQLNLEDRLETQLAEGPVDVAVISFGANDIQGLFVNGKVAPFLSAAWQAEIGARITRYVKRLQGQGAEVFWVGLPLMRDKDFDAQVQGLNAFHARLMGELGVPFIDTRRSAAGPDGAYASHLIDPKTGAPWLVRAGDGIHMSMKGYRLLTADIATRVRAWGAAARGAKPVTQDLIPPPVRADPAPTVPVEGQIGDPPETIIPDATLPAMDAPAVPATAAPPADAPTNLLPPVPESPPTAPPAEPPPPQPSPPPPKGAG